MITLVTAFYNINRGEWKNFKRSSETYLESFSKWAHLKNKLIVYVESEELKAKIIAIRSSYGLADATTVKVTDSIEKLSPEIYSRMKAIEHNKTHQLWRYRGTNPEVVNSDYNYVMYMKFWCLKDAAKCFEVEQNLAWIDFGFAHNGALYPFEEDFDFEWDYDFEDKVTLFSIKPIDERPVFDIINTMDTYIMGCIFVVPVHLVNRFCIDIDRAINSILDLGYMDDDQILLLMVLKSNPDYVTVLPSKWFLPIKQYGNKQMRVIENVKTNNLILRALRSVKKTWYRLGYLKKLDSHLKTIEFK